jgi:hypothetical protein
VKAIQILPTVPMRRFGITPLSESLYRVVFSDSRTDLLGGRWPDGACEYREVPRYPGIRGQWILEKWCSPEAYAGTKQEYELAQWDPDSHLLTCGPYPHRGEYAHCYTFPFAPGELMVQQVVWALERSRSVTPSERKQGILDPLEKQQREQDQRFDDIFGEAMGPFSKADAVIPMAARKNHHDRPGWKRGGDMPVEKYVNSPLPTRDNFFGTIQRQETIDKLTGEQNANSNAR